MIYPQYVLVRSGDSIVLTFMEDENHPTAIGLFPAEHYKIAEYLQECLNVAGIERTLEWTKN